jgi:drug/metabolite transporter (DMT)-like permease
MSQSFFLAFYAVLALYDRVVPRSLRESLEPLNHQPFESGLSKELITELGRFSSRNIMSEVETQRTQSKRNRIGYLLQILQPKFSKQWFLLLCLSLLHLVPSYLWYRALTLTSSAESAAISHTSIFFTYIIMVSSFRDAFKPSKVIAIILAIFAIYIITLASTDSLEITKDIIVQLNSTNIQSPGSALPSPQRSKNVLVDRYYGNILSVIGAMVYGLGDALCTLYLPYLQSTLRFNILYMSFVGIFTMFFLWIPLLLFNHNLYEVFRLPSSAELYYLLLNSFLSFLYVLFVLIGTFSTTRVFSVSIRR